MIPVDVPVGVIVVERAHLRASADASTPPISLLKGAPGTLPSTCTLPAVRTPLDTEPILIFINEAIMLSPGLPILDPVLRLLTCHDRQRFKAHGDCG